MSRAIFFRADLTGAELHAADLSRAELYRASLARAFAEQANFEYAFLQEADLTGANLTSASFRHADLSRARFVKADFLDADLSFANLRFADFTEARFDPKEIPTARHFAGAVGFDTLNFRRPNAVFELREHFKKSGFRRQERQLTYALNRIRRFGELEHIARFVVFEWTCRWGMAPLRPLKLILFFALMSALLYTAAFRFPRLGKLYKEFDSGKRKTLSRKNCDPVVAGFAFVLLSAFHIGWRDLNLGAWLLGVVPGNYKLRAKGVIKTVSGVQSLLSVLLIALWALTYFGRPLGRLSTLSPPQ